MKKIVATLLCFSLILSCAACTDKEETTKKKKKKTSKTEDTEDTSDEPGESSTEAPTDTTPASDSSETEDTGVSSDTSAKPSAPVFTDTLVYDHSLEFLDFENDPYWLMYGVENTNDTNNYYNSTIGIHVEYDDYWLWNPDNSDLEGVIDDIYYDIEDKYDELYEERLEEFLNSIANNQIPDTTTNIFCTTNVTRADSLFLSFYITEPEDENYTVTAYNYVSPTAETITFEDVVTDKEALCDYVSSNNLFSNTDKILAQIRDGSVPFCLTYDGIVLIDTNIYYPHKAKISAIANEGMFNMGYFGATPDSYMFEAGADDKIYWDLTGDGITDEITITYPSDTFYVFEEMTFDISGVTTTISGDVSDELDGEYEDAYLVCSNGEFFICVETTIEDDYCIQLLFRINSDLSVSYQGRFDGYYDTEPYNPNYIVVADISQFIGTGVKTNEYYFESTTDMFELYSNMTLREAHLLVTKVDIAAKDVYDGSDVEIPAGTSVTLLGYDKDAQLAYFSTLCEDDFDNEYFCLSFTIEDYHMALDAGDERDLVIGLFYAG